MTAEQQARASWEALEGARPYGGHEVIIVTVSSATAARHALASLEQLFEKASPRPRCVAVVEPATARLGNLGGTLHAWRAALQQLPDLQARLARGQRALVLHDAGRSERAEPLSSLAGSRASIRLVGGTREHPLTLLRLVAAHAQALATGAPGAVDVLWTGQLLLPDGEVRWSDAPVAKLALPVAARLPHPEDLGRFALREGKLATVWPAGTPLAPSATHWDAGPVRLHPALLDALLDNIPATPTSVDADLLRPLVDGAPSAWLARGLERAGLAPWAGIGELGAHTLWQRFRRPSEVLDASLALLHEPALRAAQGLAHPVTDSRLGCIAIRGPELSWEEVRHGITLGGVRLEDAIVSASELLDGSSLAQAAASHCRGALSLREAAALHTSCPRVSATGALLVPLADAPAQPAVLALPRSPTPALEPLLRPASAAEALRPILRACDSLAEDVRPRVTEALCALWQDARPHLPQLDEALTDAGLDTPQAHTAWALAQRHHAVAPESPERVALLSRVTVGADIAITSVLLQRLHQRYPNAELLLLGGPQCAALLGGAPRTRAVPVSYPRHGALASRLGAWLSARVALEELDVDWVIGPDSRIDQLGTLPLGARPCTVVPTTLLHSPTSHVHALNLRLDDLLGTAPHVSPAVWIDRPAVTLPPRTLALKLQSGGDDAKTLPAPMERHLVRTLLARGYTLVVDRGHGDAERQATDALLTDLTAVPLAEEPPLALAGPGLYTWTGDLVGWGRLTASAHAAIGYDSVHGHLARALGRETHVLFAPTAPPDFVRAWCPPGAVAYTQPSPEARVAALLEALP